MLEVLAEEMIGKMVKFTPQAEQFEHRRT